MIKVHTLHVLKLLSQHEVLQEWAPNSVWKLMVSKSKLNCVHTRLPSLAWQLTLSGVSKDISLSSLPPLDASSNSSFLYSPVNTTLAGGSARSKGVLPSVLRMLGSAPCWRRTTEDNDNKQWKYMHYHKIYTIKDKDSEEKVGFL